MILAPLTRGGNLPFRRLCADFGCEVSMGEMVFARHLLAGDPLEKARLRRAANEAFFGVQIATNEIDEGRGAIRLAHEAGADFVDLNCGCPIYEATRRGLGSALLRNPEKLAALVAGLAEGSPLPLSVKVRIAPEGRDVNVLKVTQLLRDAGAAAVTIHGRTAEQRYKSAADWELIARVVEEARASGPAMPIVGNGDILTHYEARTRVELSKVDAVMVGRGALIKPWLFDEFKTGRTWVPTSDERVSVYRRLAVYMREHFGDDAKGRRKAFYFLPWHFDFLSRFRPHPEEAFGALALAQPLLQTRTDPFGDETPPLERLLGNKSPAAHALIADALWEAADDADGVRRLRALAESDELKKAELDDFAAHAAPAGDAAELANVPGGAAGAAGPQKKGPRRRRPVAPQRTPEEIEALRAVRAAKRALTGAPAHRDGRALG